MNYKLISIPRLTRNPLITWIIFLFFAGFLFSCEDKTVDYGYDKYYVEIATFQSENLFLSDNGKMIVVKSNMSSKNYASGDRILLNYTLLETTASGDFNVRLNGSAKISQAKISLTDKDKISSSIKDPVLLKSAWLGSHYLNMQFYINYKSTSHKIGLLADSTRLESDTIRMYFIHDINNDPPGYPSKTYLSFDLKDVLGDPGKGRPISIQINTSNYGDKTYEFEY